MYIAHHGTWVYREATYHHGTPTILGRHIHHSAQSLFSLQGGGGYLPGQRSLFSSREAGIPLWAEVSLLLRETGIPLCAETSPP